MLTIIVILPDFFFMCRTFCVTKMFAPKQADVLMPVEMCL